MVYDETPAWRATRQSADVGKLQASRQAGKQASRQAGSGVARLRREGLLDVLLDAPQEVRPEHLVQLGDLFVVKHVAQRWGARAENARETKAGGKPAMESVTPYLYKTDKD